MSHFLFIYEQAGECTCPALATSIGPVQDQQGLLTGRCYHQLRVCILQQAHCVELILIKRLANCCCCRIVLSPQHVKRCNSFNRAVACQVRNGMLTLPTAEFPTIWPVTYPTPTPYSSKHIISGFNNK